MDHTHFIELIKGLSFKQSFIAILKDRNMELDDLLCHIYREMEQYQDRFDKLSYLYCNLNQHTDDMLIMEQLELYI
jgi:hypothetical protein